MGRIPLLSLLALLTAIAPAHADQPPHAVAHPSGRLGFILPDNTEHADTSRILIDFENTGPGEPITKADWMIEGDAVYAFDSAAGKTWSWNRIGDAVWSTRDNRTAVALLAPPPSERGTFSFESAPDRVVDPDRLRALARTPFDLRRLPPWPTEFLPTAPKTFAWPTNHPPTLSARLGPDLAARTWRVAAEQSAPSILIHATNLPLAVEIVRPLTGTIHPLTNGVMSTDETRMRWSGTSDDIQWSILIDIAPSTGWTRVSAHLVSSNNQPVQLRLGVRTPLNGWTWHEDLATTAELDRSSLPRTASPETINGTDYSSTPIAAISDPSWMIAVMNDPAEPRLCRLVADPRHDFFGLVYEAALSRQPVRFPGQATFQGAIYSSSRTPSEPPFRTALDQMMRAFPEAYRARTPLAFSRLLPFADASTATLSNAPRPSIALYAGTDTPPPFATAWNLLYTEPWHHWLRLDDATPRTEEAALARLDLLATTGHGPRHQMALATLNSLVRRADPSPAIDFADLPWNHGARVTVSADPDLPIADGPACNRGLVEAARVDSASPTQGWRGVWIDGLASLADDNTHPAAIAQSDVPLIMDPASGLAAQSARLLPLEWLYPLRHALNSRGQWLAGQGALSCGPFYTSFFDLYTEDVRAAPADAKALVAGPWGRHLRMRAGTKPVAIFLYHDFTATEPDELASFLSSCLLYGFLPVLHSKDGFNGAYAPNSGWQARDHAVWETWMPVLTRVANAGWNPARPVHLSHPAFDAECFGPDQNTLWLTLHNPTPTPQRTGITWPPAFGEFIMVDPFHARMMLVSPLDETPVDWWVPGDTTTALMLMPTARLADEAAWFSRIDSEPARACATNLWSILREREADLDVRIDHDTPAIRGADLDLRLTFGNRGQTPVSIDDLILQSNNARHPVKHPPIPLAPGEGKTIFVRLGAADLKGDPMITVRWTAIRATAHTQGTRRFAPPFADPVEIIPPPRSITSIDSAAALEVTIANNRPEVRVFDIDIAGKQLEAPIRESVRIESSSVATPRYVIPGDDQYLQDVTLTIRDGKTVLINQPVSISYLPVGANILRDSRVTITSETSLDGYDPMTLRDGVTDSGGGLWTETSWKSPRHTGVHRVTVTLPQPVPLSAIRLHWPTEAQTIHAPARGEVRARLHDDRTVRLGPIAPRPGETMTTFTLDSLVVDRFEIIQSPGGGSRSDPFTLWLTEIEAE